MLMNDDELRALDSLGELNGLARAAAEHIRELQTKINERDLVPGVMRCAKCSFELVRTTLYFKAGTFGPGDSNTEPCPNGCGPLWPVTWKQHAQGWAKSVEVVLSRAVDAEALLSAAIAHLRAIIGSKSESEDGDLVCLASDWLDSLPNAPAPKPRKDIGQVRLVQMDSKAAQREPPRPDLWQVTISGYMVGAPIAIEQAMSVRTWLEGGALADLSGVINWES